ncbi:SDR family NAD(P)-dependent oxidoreductase, partial [Achromobacter sp. GG226]|nr:SDR family NAD(P)-dependent oxidoreductase [Verticiella sp. GG226]
MPDTILIAGCGDLGQRTAARLAAQGHAVWGLRRRPPT